VWHSHSIRDEDEEQWRKRDEQIEAELDQLYAQLALVKHMQWRVQVAVELLKTGEWELQLNSEIPEEERV
jgi:hypothetical protein